MPSFFNRLFVFLGYAISCNLNYSFDFHKYCYNHTDFKIVGLMNCFNS
jgi:hypothetical protein